MRSDRLSCPPDAVKAPDNTACLLTTITWAASGNNRTLEDRQKTSAQPYVHLCYIAETGAARDPVRGRRVCQVDGRLRRDRSWLLTSMLNAGPAAVDV